MESHRSAVEKIAASVQHYYQRQEPFRIYHGSTNCTRPRTHHRHKNSVDISALSRILEVDTEAKTALVEPNVPMDRLAEFTMRHGLIPPVVMEFPGITAGGGFAGTGGESSSFKYGYFNDTVISVEMVLGNGEIVTASDQENVDLFRGASGGLGSLGITTLLKLQLVQAKTYVKATYIPVRSISEAVEKVREETMNPGLVDYVDGILFSKDHGVIVTGSMTDDIPATASPQSFSDAWDPWFYLHVKQTTVGSDKPVTQYIPLAEYLFRYDRGGFWVGASAFNYFKTPFNALTRWWLDDFLHTRMLYRTLHASGQSNSYIIQDLALPYPTVETFIEYAIKSFGIWPLWLCPLRQTTHFPTLHPHSHSFEADDDGTTTTLSKPLLNVGLWGFGPTSHPHFIAKNRELEAKLVEFGGMKWLYAHTYYTEAEFWTMFDRGWYDGLRRKYHAGFLPSVWDKTKVKLHHSNTSLKKKKQGGDGDGGVESEEDWATWALWTWPLGGIWGIWKAVMSGEWRVARGSRWRMKRKKLS